MDEFDEINIRPSRLNQFQFSSLFGFLLLVAVLTLTSPESPQEPSPSPSPGAAIATRQPNGQTQCGRSTEPMNCRLEVANKSSTDPMAAVAGIPLDLRYATDNNFLGRKVYEDGTCYLKPKAALALQGVQERLKEKGYSLKLWDCYRPPSVQEKMWAILPDPNYVANPATGSVHNRGLAVDVTLVKADGSPILMPTEFDTFNASAHWESISPQTPAGANALLLKSAMEEGGFSAIATEWWHYDFKN